MDNKIFSSALKEFIEKHNLNFNKIVPIKVDASKRKYYRIEKTGKSKILMDSTLEKKSMKTFIKMSDWLISNKLSAPLIFEKDLAEGICMIEDFGENKFNKVLKKSSEKTDILYKKTIELLRELSKIPFAKFLPSYSYKIFKSELDIFLEWYFFFKQKRDAAFLKEWNFVWKKYYNIIKKSQFKTTVLRDFHIDNLFFLDNRIGIKKIGLIDFQDAVCGHNCYDLVSLLQDVRVTLPFKKQQFFYHYYLSINNISEKKFQESYYIFGTQRLLKIIGIFNRLKYRDNKNNYIKYMPRTFKLLENNLNNPLMTDVRILLKNIF